MMEFLFGHARRRITPPLGITMMGYGARTEGAKAIHDDLWANAVALSDGTQRLLVLALDVCEMPLYTTHLLKGAIMQATGLQPDQILINTSHTHAGPDVGVVVSEDALILYEPAYFVESAQVCANVCQDALADLAPATLRVGSAAVDVGGSRRERTPDGTTVIGVNPEGPRMPVLTAWTFSRPEATDVIWWTLPLHGATVTADNLQISAEWMGAAVRRFEADQDETVAVFLQGCCGDQNPYRERNSFEQMDEHGVDVALALEDALASSQDVESLPLVHRWRTVLLPSARGGFQRLPVHGLRLGDAALVSLAGEPFVAYALHGQGLRPGPATMVLGYTDGTVGYLPTADAFEEGGYEPNSWKGFADGEPLTQQVEGIVKETIAAMFAELDGAGV
jgi:neutral ceramidase